KFPARGSSSNTCGSRGRAVDHLWSPWRYRYLANVERKPGCVFCRVIGEQQDDRNFVVHRATFNFVILNLYPYASVHLLIVPYHHAAALREIDEATLTEMMQLATRAESALGSEYKPDGFNVGMNLGQAAGAGIADHLHLHVVPRWTGDANFVSIVGETRVLPEELPVTWNRLRKHFPG